MELQLKMCGLGLGVVVEMDFKMLGGSTRTAEISKHVVVASKMFGMLLWFSIVQFSSKMLWFVVPRRSVPNVVVASKEMHFAFLRIWGFCMGVAL